MNLAVGEESFFYFEQEVSVLYRVKSLLYTGKERVHLFALTAGCRHGFDESHQLMHFSEV